MDISVVIHGFSLAFKCKMLDFQSKSHKRVSIDASSDYFNSDYIVI